MAKASEGSPLRGEEAATVGKFVVAYSPHGSPLYTFVQTGRGVWIRTDPCVAFVDCSYCGASAGSPCRSRTALREPRAGTHCTRRGDYARLRREERSKGG